MRSGKLFFSELFAGNEGADVDDALRSSLRALPPNTLDADDVEIDEGPSGSDEYSSVAILLISDGTQAHFIGVHFS